MGEKFNSRRDFIKTGLLATAGILVGSLSETKSQTSSEDKERYDKLIHELFLEKKIIPNEGKEFSEKIDLWEKRYSGNDEGYDKLELLYRKRHNLPLKTINQELKEGWGRLLECDLETVYQITETQGVPFDLIFVALAESHWKNEARSAVGAGGPWQFMPGTARAFGLKVNSQKKIDERLNVQKSTEAACKYLKKLYAKTKSLEIPEGDRWTWAFWAYNRGEGHVFGTHKKEGDFSKAKGDPNKYSIYCKNRESLNYAPKIFGLARALEKIVLKKEKPEESKEINNSEADCLFEEYSKNNSISPEKALDVLEEIVQEFKEEEVEGIHTSSYVESALDIICKEIDEVKRKIKKEIPN